MREDQPDQPPDLIQQIRKK